MDMLQGNTYLKPVRVEDSKGNVVGADRVAKVEIVFGELYKYYGTEDGEVYWDALEECFIVPLTEEDTFSLEGAVDCQVRAVLVDGSVSGSKPEGHYVYESKSKTRLTEGGAGNESGELLTLKLMKEFVYVGGGTGEGGTSDYNELTNKPMINGVELVGNKTTEDLGIVSEESDPTVPSYVKRIKKSDIESWNNKVEQSQVENINNSIADIEENKASVDYVDTQVDEVREVAEGKTKSFTIDTLADLGTLLGIDTSVVADEYTITSTTITYKEQSIELKQGDLLLIVDTSVPDYWVSVDDMKIYKMETTKVDLTDYVKNTDFATNIIAGIVKVNPNDGIGIGNTSKALFVSPATQTEIDGKTSTRKPIVPATLDYAVKVGMTTNTEEWTNEEKENARNLIGVPTFTATQLEDGSYSLTIE